MESTKKTNTQKGEEQILESISKKIKAVDPKAAIDVYLLDKKKLDNPEEQLSCLTEVVNHESLLWEPDRKVMLKYIPVVKRFIDDRFDSYKFQSCGLSHETDNSNGNILMETVSRGKKVNFIQNTFVWEEIVWITFVPFEFDDLPSSYVLVRIKNEWTDEQKLREFIDAINKKLEELGARPKYGLLNKTLQTRSDKVRSTYRKYKVLSFVFLVAGFVLACFIIGSLS